MNWAATEFENIDLGEPRRNRRATRLVERLSANPTASIPQACGDWAETVAAHRFFGNVEVQWADTLAPHLCSVNLARDADGQAPRRQREPALD